MYKQQFSLDNLVELKENEEKEKSKLPYKKYLENLLYLANADNSSIYSSILNILGHLFLHFQDNSCILFPHKSSL